MAAWQHGSTASMAALLRAPGALPCAAAPPPPRAPARAPPPCCGARCRQRARRAAAASLPPHDAARAPAVPDVPPRRPRTARAAIADLFAASPSAALAEELPAAMCVLGLGQAMVRARQPGVAKAAPKP
jgi:hypothetical protein